MGEIIRKRPGSSTPPAPTDSDYPIPTPGGESMRTPRIASIAFILLALVCLPAPGYGTTYNVPGHAATIQGGIDLASSGDTVLVECGTYLEYNINLKAGVTLRSETGEADCVTIDAQSLGRVFGCSVDTAVEGFTITGGAAAEGGGVYCSANPTFRSCRFLNNHASSRGGGLYIASNYDPTLIGCRFEGNTSDSWGGGVFMDQNCDPTFTDCAFLNNSAVDYGGAYSNFFGGYPHFTDCRFEGNSCDDRGGAILAWWSNPTFDYCVFANNSGEGRGGAIYSFASSTILNNCTFYGNESQTSEGDAVHIASGTVSFSNCIISFSTQAQAVYCVSGTPNLSCANVYGNAGGDYVGCLADWADTNGNFSEDPLFCDAAGGDYRVRSDSPCLDYGGCGIIGARGWGCWGGPTWITDVGNDQGRRVRVRWQRAWEDTSASDTSIVSYSIWRRVDEYLARGGRSEPEALGSGLGYPPGDWDFVKSVPACGEWSYSTTAETLCDSTDQGICWSVFFIRAHTDDPLIYFDSGPDSGYSVDNLAPAPPPGLMMTSPNELVWEEVPDEDFDYYSVYGSDQPALDGTATSIGYTIGTTKDVVGHIYDYYHVTATDFSGNEGNESSVNNTYAGVPDMPDAPDVPAAFALGQNRPNPFASSTVIAFDLPEATGARIKV
jgi:parallel beta-helix repeat protein/predicted outer membrane repeat protein